MNLLYLLLGLGLILAGAHFLTDGSAALAQRLRVPEFIVGLTVVAVGTSTPELIVSVLSALKGQSDLAVGNVVGSNLFNTLVILGLCALVRPLRLSEANIRRDIPAGLAASVLLLVAASDRLLRIGAADRIGRLDGAIFLVLYIALMGYTIRTAQRPAPSAVPSMTPSAAPSAVPESGFRKAPWLLGLMIVGGLGALIGGGELFLHGATALARKLGVSESVIAITLVAGGTSLPELASSLVALGKGKADLALGNILGSNATNILLILGLSAAIHPLTPGGITTVDLAAVVLSSVLLLGTAFSFRRRTVDRWEGALFLAIYAAYIGYLLR